MISQSDLDKIFRDCNSLVHVPIPFDDLMECVIGQDIRSQQPEVADMIEGWIARWLEWGYTEQQVVDIFSAIMVGIYSSEHIDDMLSDINQFLENNND